ncbi:hypothetical protein, partial [Moorena sp. SIO3I6]
MEAVNPNCEVWESPVIISDLTGDDVKLYLLPCLVLGSSRGVEPQTNYLTQLVMEDQQIYQSVVNSLRS